MILVTGANGFLGSRILAELLDRRVAVRATGLEDSSIVSGVEYVRADITRPNTLSRTLEGVDTVIHAAGLAHLFSPAPADVQRFPLVNEIGTLNVAAEAAGQRVRHFVHVSTVAVYGLHSASSVTEDHPCMPQGAYAESKYAGELCALEAGRENGMNVTVLRLATLYGEGDPGNILRLIESLRRRRFVWIGSGRNLKSLVYVGDAARACAATAVADEAGTGTFNVSAPPVPMREIVLSICSALGRRPPRLKIPAALVMTLLKMGSILPTARRLRGTLEKWLADDVYDASRFAEAFGSPVQVGVAEGLRREVEWERSGG